MKNKKKLIIPLCVLVLLIAIFIGGSTFSKYITELNGNGTANIAKWSFKVNGNKEMLQTVKLENTCDAKKLVNGKIAPGTSGAFKINIDATTSEVGIDYKVEFKNEKNKPRNLKFQYGDKIVNTIKELEDALKGRIDANEESKSRELTIQWFWKYETGSNVNEIIQNDKLDTEDAINVLNYTFDINITGTQVLPNA